MFYKSIEIKVYVLCQATQNVLIRNIYVVENNETCLGNL
jgi:hypothetical protein